MRRGVAAALAAAMVALAAAVVVVDGTGPSRPQTRSEASASSALPAWAPHARRHRPASPDVVVAPRSSVAAGVNDLLAVTAPGAVAGPGAYGSPSYDPCSPEDTTLPNEGPSLAMGVNVPSVPPTPLPGPAAAFDPNPGEVPAAYAATIVRPADTNRYPGARPAVVLLHGIYGDQCQMWWLGRYLAGAGYVALLVTSPTPPEHDASYGVAIDATRSAVDFLATPVDNPFAFATDPNRVGIAGWSEGSVAASVVQGLPDMGAVKAIVALDDLRGSLLGDSGAPMTFCVPPVRSPLNPRVPALGFASDNPCDVAATGTGPGVKLSGFSRWRAAGVASVELPLAGYDHFDYAVPGAKLVPVAELTLAWLDAWLLGTTGSLASFHSCFTHGVPTAGALSSTYASGAYLPLFGIDSSSWARDLAARCDQSPAEVGTTPMA